MNKEKAKWEVTLKNILYYIDDEKEQQKVLEILGRYEAKLLDNKLKNFFQKIIFSTKTDYYSKVDYLVDDILDGRWNVEIKKILNNMLAELKPAVEKAEKNFWERLVNIFQGS